ncbi:MAG: hypothetical protein LBM98_03800 [Oscillospiraceae bacterium]|nr:hypothetical protein [Oscillospiraceae bacterium]
MRYVQCYRCEAIQCRGENIRICGLRHWIASPLYVLRIVGLPRLAKTAHGAGTWKSASLIRGWDEVTSRAARETTPPPTGGTPPQRG